VTIATPETWVAGLFARFDAAEEGTERPVQARDRILQKMHVDGGDVLPFGPYVFELRHLLVRADRYAAFLVGVAPLLQCRVVQLAEPPQRRVQDGLLRGRGVQSIPVDAEHVRTMLGSCSARKHSIATTTPFFDSSITWFW